jgi:hypothetical protein
MPSKYGTSVLRRFTNPRGEVQYRTSELMVNAGVMAYVKRFAAKLKRFKSN